MTAEPRNGAHAVAVNIPLSSAGRRKRVPTIATVPPQTPAERLIEQLVLGKKNDWWGDESYCYSDDGLAAAFGELGIVQAELRYSGGNDEGSVDAINITHEDGRNEQWEETWPEPDKPDERLKWLLIDALWQPASHEWGSFAGEYSVEGTVTWTAVEGLDHSYEEHENPDWCNACDASYDAGTVSFHEVDGKEGYPDHVCEHCYEKIKAGTLVGYKLLEDDEPEDEAA